MSVLLFSKRLFGFSLEGIVLFEVLKIGVFLFRMASVFWRMRSDAVLKSVVSTMPKNYLIRLALNKKNKIKCR